jgi:hypothetical protein
VEHDEEEDEIVNDELPPDDETPADEEEVDDGQVKPFTCALCSMSFSKFEAYREHFVSTEHRYKRRDEKKRRGVRCSKRSFLSISGVYDRKVASSKVHQWKSSSICCFTIR